MTEKRINNQDKFVIPHSDFYKHAFIYQERIPYILLFLWEMMHHAKKYQNLKMFVIMFAHLKLNLMTILLAVRPSLLIMFFF